MISLPGGRFRAKNIEASALVPLAVRFIAGAAAFAITIQGNAAELIDGSNTLATAAARDRVTLQSDGTGWTRVA